ARGRGCRGTCYPCRPQLRPARRWRAMTQVMAAPTPLRHPGAVARNAQGPDRRSGAPLAQRAPAARRARLLATRVSRVIEAHPDALGVQSVGGFATLAHPARILA